MVAHEGFELLAAIEDGSLAAQVSERSRLAGAAEFLVLKEVAVGGVGLRLGDEIEARQTRDERAVGCALAGAGLGVVQNRSREGCVFRERRVAFVDGGHRYTSDRRCRIPDQVDRDVHRALILKRNFRAKDRAKRPFMPVAKIAGFDGLDVAEWCSVSG